MIIVISGGGGFGKITPRRIEENEGNVFPFNSCGKKSPPLQLVRRHLVRCTSISRQSVTHRLWETFGSRISSVFVILQISAFDGLRYL